MNFSRYCRCGATLRGTVHPDGLAVRLLAEFDQQHLGDGHAPTDAVTASRARRTEERAMLAEGGETP